MRMGRSYRDEVVEIVNVKSWGILTEVGFAFAVGFHRDKIQALIQKMV